MGDWPKGPTKWIANEVLYVSIPFTWNLPEIKSELIQGSFFWQRAIVGGPAVKLMPNYLAGLPGVEIQDHYPGVLQKVNPMATRTTTGCIRNCGFCAVRSIEGGFQEMLSWPDFPVITDNNILAASFEHFEKVIDRLVKWGWADFDQGLDARILSDWHAEQIARIKKPMVRLALDSMKYIKSWRNAFDMLRNAGIAKSNIRSYALIAYDSTPEECWERCEFIQSHGVLALPQWFHRLDALERNQVTVEQRALGWTSAKRKNIMGYYYKHRGKVGG